MWGRLALGAVAVFLAKAFSGFFTRLWFVLRQLWHEVIGFVFLVLAVWGASTTIREYRAGGGSRLLFAAGFTLMTAYFGVTSFRNARRVRPPGETPHS